MCCTTEISLSTYIRPPSSPSVPNLEAPWLILLFVPIAFSFVCETEVLMFQSRYRDFRDRNCSVIFISTETKHALWHWTHIPYEHGGLGHIDIPLLSDPSHKVSKDYGVLMQDEGEEENVWLRGTFIVNGEGLLQQVCLPCSGSQPV